jgi:ADP-ribose pyrophosphatase YjhB (NUDIX family)
MPVTSIGIIAFRINNKNIEYLMVRRKETLGFVDFMRAKFDINEKFYILNMIKQMTNQERQILLAKYNSYKENCTINNVKEKIIVLITGITNNYGFYDLKTLIEECNNEMNWDFPEWGFPKGRRNNQESDYNCATREFSEETGYKTSVLQQIKNIVPLEEIFSGSNYNSYRHKYYINYISLQDSLSKHSYQKSEISALSWLTYDQCISVIRPYNLEKLSVLENVNNCLNTSLMFSIVKNNIDTI